MEKEIAQDLLKFIQNSPSCYHVIKNMEVQLEAAGYKKLREEEAWTLERGKGYFVTRNSSSLAAFRIPKDGEAGFQMIASHSDSPSFKIKENPETETEQQYVRLNVEKYGGMLMASWMDRPLSVAGRILVEEEGALVEKLVNVDRDLLIIPNLAIHMNREANKGFTWNVQTDLLPVFSGTEEKKTFYQVIAESAGVCEENILGSDLFLYNRMAGTKLGASGEYIASPKLDDLQCAYAALRGFLESRAGKNIAVYCIFDNEETGSRTKQGAASGFLKDTLMRIAENMGKTREEYCRMLAESFLLSADNAHGVHPAHPEKADPKNRPYLNGGIVLKHHANQKYTTDGRSAAVVRMLCKKAEIPLQNFTNRSDMEGGSTLGNIASEQVSVDMADIGLAQWAMHSAYETAGAKDTGYMTRLAQVFYECQMIRTATGRKILTMEQSRKLDN